MSYFIRKIFNKDAKKSGVKEDKSDVSIKSFKSPKTSVFSSVKIFDDNAPPPSIDVIDLSLPSRGLESLSMWTGHVKRSKESFSSLTNIYQSDDEDGRCWKRLAREKKLHHRMRLRRLDRIDAKASEDNTHKEMKVQRMRLIERHREMITLDADAKNSKMNFTDPEDDPEIKPSVESNDKLQRSNQLIEKANMDKIKKMLKQKPQIFLGDLQILSDISSGKLSRVLYAIRQEDKEINEFAIRVKEKDVRMWKTIKNELKIMEKSTFSEHPFIVQIYNFIHTKGHLCFVMEYMNGGCLKTHLMKEKRFEEWRSLFYSTCILQAITYLHNIDISHRAINLGNILLDKEGFAKLSGFGSAQFVDEKLPEYDKLGITNFEQKLLDFRQLAHLIHLMISGLHLQTFPHPKVNKRLSRIAQEALVEIFSLKASNFPTAVDVGQLPFFKQINWEQLSDRSIKPPYYQRLNLTDSPALQIFETMQNSQNVKGGPFEKYFDRAYLWKIE